VPLPTARPSLGGSARPSQVEQLVRRASLKHHSGGTNIRRRAFSRRSIRALLSASDCGPDLCGAKHGWATSILLQFTNNSIHHRQKIFKPCSFRQRTHHDARSSRDHVRGEIHAIDLVESGKKLYSLRFLFKGRLRISRIASAPSRRDRRRRTASA